MAVTIVVSRQVANGCLENVLGLIKIMRLAAEKQPGFILGNTLRVLPQSKELLVISRWRSIEDWNQWFDHPRRMALQKQMDAFLEGRTEYTISRDC